MADTHDSDSQRVQAPVLLQPREAAVVNGQTVAFAWEGFPGSRDHRLQVARDASFGEIVYEENVGGGTSIDVSEVFGQGRELFYWRILAADADGQVHGYDSVESFIASTDEDAAAAPVNPDETEDLGIYPELFSAAAVEAAAEVSGDSEFYAEEAAMGVQHEGVEAGQIMGIFLATTVGLVLAIIAVFVITDREHQLAIAELREGARYPELIEVRNDAAQKLTQVQVVNEEQQIYQIPIDRAIDLMVRESYNETGRTYSSELQLRPGN